jgi:hypothetical protein
MSYILSNCNLINRHRAFPNQAQYPRIYFYALKNGQNE